MSLWFLKTLKLILQTGINQVRFLLYSIYFKLNYLLNDQLLFTGLVVYDKIKKLLYVQCKENTWINVDKIVIPGKKPQSPKDFGSGFLLNQKEKSCIFY